MDSFKDIFDTLGSYFDGVDVRIGGIGGTKGQGLRFSVAPTFSNSRGKSNKYNQRRRKRKKTPSRRKRKKRKTKM